MPSLDKHAAALLAPVLALARVRPFMSTPVGGCLKLLLADVALIWFLALYKIEKIFTILAVKCAIEFFF